MGNPTQLRSLDVAEQHRRASVPECRGRPLCLPIRIAPALRRDAESCKPLLKKSNQQNSTPKSASADSPPPAGDRRPGSAATSSSAHGSPRPRGTGALGAPTSSSAHRSTPPAGTSASHQDISSWVLVPSGSVAWTETCITWLRALPLVSPAGGDGREAAGGGWLRVARVISTGQRGASGQSGQGRRGGLCGLCGARGRRRTALRALPISGSFVPRGRPSASSPRAPPVLRVRL